MSARDYSEWLKVEDRLEIEERHWAEEKLYVRYAASLMRATGTMGAFRWGVLEMGCGTGWVPRELSGAIPYVGVDANSECLRRARQKNLGSRAFLEADARELTPYAAVVCAFAFLKHFALEEWDRLFVQWFGQCHVAVFSAPIAEMDADDGTEFPHVYRSEVGLAKAIALADLRELWRDTTNPIEPIIACGRRVGTEAALPAPALSDSAFSTITKARPHPNPLPQERERTLTVGGRI